MDPYSVATESATLLGFTVLVSAVLYGPWKTPTSIIGPLLNEVSQLRRALESIEGHAAEVDSPIALPHLPAIYEECKTLLVPLYSRLSQTRTSAFEDKEWNWRIYDPSNEGRVWPLEKHYTLNVVESLHLCRTRLQALLSSNPAMELQPAASSGTEQSTEHGISRNEWLWRKTAEYSSVHASVQSRRVFGTGAWLLNEHSFQKWLRSDRGRNILCCVGLPGSGKSILTSLVVDETTELVKRETGRDFGVAYFYFNYRTPLPMQTVALTLLQQLFLQAPNAIDEIKRLAERKGGFQPASLHDVLPVLLLVAGMFQRTYIILDALDECTSESHRDLYILLDTVKGSPFRLFVTGRPSQAVSMFKDEASIRIEAPREDIMLLARAVLRDAHHIGAEIREQVARKVAAGSNGMFLLPALQLQKVLQAHTPEEIQSVLSQLPNTLASVYDDQVERISCHERKDMAFSAISILYYALAPLTVEELQGALLFNDAGLLTDESVSLYDAGGKSYGIEAILDACMGLIAVNSSTGTVSLVHYSVYEYLGAMARSGYRPPGREYSIAMSCVQFLLRNEFATCPRTIDDVRKRVQTYPFYLYAASSWGHHARAISASERDDRMLKRISEVLQDETRLQGVVRAMFRDLPTSWPTLDNWPPRFSNCHVATYFGLDSALSFCATSSMSTTDSWGKTPLHIAAEFGFPKCAEIFLDNHVDVNYLDSSGKTPMHYAALGGHTDVAKMLLNRAKVNLAIEDEAGHEERSGHTALAYAASGGHLTFLKIILDHSDSAPQPEMHSILRAAIVGAQSKVVELLLEHGIAPHYDDVIDAIDSGVEESVELLIETGTDLKPSTPGRIPLLHAAVLAGQNTIVRLLLDNGADVQAQDAAGRTAFSHAVEREDLTSIKYLLEAGAKADVLIRKDETALVYASARGMEGVAKALILVCPLTSALGVAAANGHENIVRLLLRSGAEVDQANGDGMKPLQLASMNGYADLVELLVSAGADTKVLSNDIDEITPQRSVSPISSEGTPSTLRMERSTAAALSKTAPDNEASRPSERKELPTMGSSLQSPEVGQVVSPTRNQADRRQPSWLLTEPLPNSEMRRMLGAIVQDCRHPLQSYAPSDLQMLEETIGQCGAPQVTIMRDYKMERSTTKQHNFLRDILDSGSSGRRESLMALSADTVTTYGLANHEAVFAAVVARFGPEVLIHLEAPRKFSGKAYMVVGLQTWKDARILKQLSERSDKNLSIGVPTASVMAAVGVPITIGPSVGWSHSNEMSSTEAQLHKGDVVFAVQYRTVKLKTSIFREKRLALGDYPKLSAAETLY